MGAEPAVDWALIGSLAFGLFMFGIAFNGLIHILGDRKRGYVSLLVALGVIVTLGAVAIVDWRAALLTAGFFVASGVPMIGGEAWRAIVERERALKVLRGGDE